MLKNTASQKVAVFAWNNSAGSAKTGDSANITAQISKDGGACAATNDVNPTELDATDAPGIYIFDMLQTETNADLVVISPTSSTSDIDFRPIIIYTKTVMRGTDSAATSADLSAHDAKLDAVDTVVDAILVDTNELQVDFTNGGRLDLLIDAIKAKTDNLLDSWNDITVANILAGIIEGTYDLKECMRLLLAFTAGKASGGGSATVTFRDTADSKDRLVMTVDDSGNRAAVVIDVS